MLTSCILFEKRHKLPEASLGKDLLLAKIMQINSILGGLIIPHLCAAQMYANPCMPPFVGFLLLKWGDTCYASGTFGSILLTLGIILNTYLWYGIISTASWVIFNTGYVSVKCLDHYLRQAREMLRKPENVCPKRDIQNAFQFYRQIQIIGVIFNEENQSLSQPTLMMGVVMTTTSCLYTCIKLHRYVPMPGFLLFPISLADSFLIMFNAKVASGVLAESKRCLEVARNNSGGGGMPRSLYRRMVKAMGRVMIRFGSTNYFDQQTPFNLINHALSASVSAMLLN